MNKGNQYIVYGTLVSEKWYNEFIEKADDNVFPISEKFVGSITPMFYGRDGKFMIIGEILIKTSVDDLITIPEINDERQAYVKNRVKELYGLDGDFNYFYLKIY